MVKTHGGEKKGNKTTLSVQPMVSFTIISDPISGVLSLAQPCEIADGEMSLEHMDSSMVCEICGGD